MAGEYAAPTVLTEDRHQHDGPATVRDVMTRAHAFRSACLVILGVTLVFAAWEFAVLVPYVLSQKYALGVDFHQYMGATRSWLDGDGFYKARQLGGPYVIEGGDILYPPTLLYLLVPFVVLPEFLWWLIPIGIVSYTVWRLRPALWALVLIAIALALPRDQALILFGNPTMWTTAAVAAGVLWGWPAAFVLLKPSLAPFALLGITTRGWWIVVVALAVATLPLLPLFFQYLAVLRDSNATIAYSLQDVPIVLVPLIAMLGSAEARRRVLSWPWRRTQRAIDPKPAGSG